jgi:hypothetical protein
VVALTVVNHSPVASDFTAATAQDQPLSLAVENLLTLASDPDGDSLTVSAVSPASTNGGLVTLSSDAVTYTPVSGFVGQDLFTYTVSDGLGGTATANVLVSVLPGTVASQTMLPPAPTANGVLVSFAGIVGSTYTVQRAPTVDGPWVTLGTAAVDWTGLGSLTDTNPPPDDAFYRTVYP